MSLKSIGQYWNHLRRSGYDKLWFSWRRQHARLLIIGLITVQELPEPLLTTDAKSCSQNSEDPNIYQENLVIGVPPEDTFWPLKLRAVGWWCPLESRLHLTSGWLRVGDLMNNRDSHPAKESLTLNSQAACAARPGHLNSSLPYFTLWTHTHICFKLFLYMRKDKRQIFSWHLLLPHKI